ncbi:hypothetical protein Tco_0017918 [Tanacetum coccineum]
MSGSEHGEMAPESSHAVVLPKFDMHIYTLILTSGELKYAIVEYCIPGDLHLRLPPPEHNYEQAFIIHFGVHVSQLVPMGVNRVILFEIRCRSLDINPTVSLFRVFYKLCKQGHWVSFENKTGGRSKKCFKEVTSSLKDLRDDFLTHYSKSDATLLAEFVVPLRPHPSSHNSTPTDKGANSREESLSKKTLRNQNSKIAPAKEKKEQKNLAKLQAKYAGEGVLEAPRKKRKEPATVTPIGLTMDATNVEKEVVDLSGNTRASTPPATAIQPSPRLELTASDDMFFSSFSLGELLKRHEQLNHNYVDMCNRSDAHLVELDRLRTSLQREMKANDGLTKRFALLDSVHSLCSDRERELVDRELEGKKAALEAGLARVEVDRQKLVREFIPAVYPYIQKVADSYHLSMDDLMKVSPDAPPPPSVNEAGTSTADGTDGAAQRSPPPA